jgi:response regulator RpfG family c-di-GMP phosphodiesterase
VYKEAFGHEIAKDILTKESGTHFDPAVFQAFLASEQAFVAVYERFREAHAAAAA